MWNQTTEQALLELREDAVLIFRRQSSELICLNEAARKLFGNAEGKHYAELIDHQAVDNLLRGTQESGRLGAATLEQVPWFEGSAVIHTVLTDWNGEDCFAVTLDRRLYGPPPEALQLMKAVLTASYFTAIRVDLQTLRASVMNSVRPLLSTQPNFRDYSDFIRIYAEAMIHPEDREQFLNCFSVEQLHLFMEADTAPTCTVRRQSDEEYRWASFTLAAVNSNIILMLGKDSNEQQLQKERSDRYQSELQSVSRRNDYILSSMRDIFRLMLHIDLRTGDTVICSMHPAFEAIFSYDTVYPYEEIYQTLVGMAYEEDRAMMTRFSDFTQLATLVAESEYKLAFEYRRISRRTPENPKWTRSVITLLQFENGVPTEAVYTVQDIDAQHRRDLEAKQRQESLSNQFRTLIRNRYIWFIDSDYTEQVSHCYRIADRNVTEPFDVPFGQFFERIIMPTCHPEDFKTVAKMLLPTAAAEAYRKGAQELSLNFRHRFDGEWKVVRAELYFQTDGRDHLHAMLYISDVDQAVQHADRLTKFEHQQLMLRKKFCLTIQDSYIRIGEVDLDADRISHYRLNGGDFEIVEDPTPFSRLCDSFAENCIYPGHVAAFTETFSYQQIRYAAREHIPMLRQSLMIDLEHTGEYRWCNMVARFFHDENGKPYIMTYIEDTHDEVCRRDAQVFELESTRAQLVSALREKEEHRIRKAHFYLDLGSNFQLLLNQIYAAIDALRTKLADADTCPEEIEELSNVYEQLTAMTTRAKDILLLENNQLPLLSEPVSLHRLLQQIKENQRAVFYGKNLRIMTYTSHVTEEIVCSDARRLTDLIESVFISVISSLPENCRLTLQLSQSPVPERKNTALYEFSMITYGNQLSQSKQSDLCEPVTQSEAALRTIADEFRNFTKLQQYSLYFCKRLIEVLGGKLEYVQLPDGASAVIVRLPLTYLPTPVRFPHMFWLNKRVFVWDSVQQYAIATMELLRETGMRIDWQVSYDNLCSNLHAAEAQNAPCSLIVLKQTDLNAESRACLWELNDRMPQIPILLLADAPPAVHAKPAPDQKNIYYLPTPLFRSVLAEKLWEIAKDAEAPEQ